MPITVKEHNPSDADRAGRRASLRRAVLSSRRADILGSRRGSLCRDVARNDRDRRLVGAVLQRGAVLRQAGPVPPAAGRRYAGLRPERVRRAARAGARRPGARRDHGLVWRVGRVAGSRSRGGRAAGGEPGRLRPGPVRHPRHALHGVPVRRRISSCGGRAAGPATMAVGRLRRHRAGGPHEGAGCADHLRSCARARRDRVSRSQTTAARAAVDDRPGARHPRVGAVVHLYVRPIPPRLC